MRRRRRSASAAPAPALTTKRCRCHCGDSVEGTETRRHGLPGRGGGGMVEREGLPAHTAPILPNQAPLRSALLHAAVVGGDGSGPAPPATPPLHDIAPAPRQTRSVQELGMFKWL
jgi:hypothetical protein